MQRLTSSTVARFLSVSIAVCIAAFLTAADTLAPITAIPPAASVEPEAVPLTLQTGTMSMESVLLINSGDATLSWQAQILSAGPLPASPSTPLDLTGLKILFTTWENFAGAPTTLIGDLESRGATVDVLNYQVNPWLLLDDTYDILWLQSIGEEPIGSNRDLLLNWIALGGKGILLAGVTFWTIDTGNFLSDSLNAGFTGQSIQTVSGVTSDFDSHPITMDVDSLESLTTYYAGFTTVNLPAGTLFREPNGSDVAIHSSPGTSRIAFIGYDLFWNNRINLADNRLLANQTIDWLTLGTFVSWVDVVPTVGSTVAGDTTVLTLDFDATALGLGVYDAILRINSDDPINPVIDVPIELTVIGEPDITVTDSLIDFGTVVTLTSENEVLNVANDGTDTLFVSNVLTSDPEFSVNPTNFNVPPSQDINLTVALTPLVAGAKSGDLTIISNDPDEDSVVVALLGTAVDGARAQIDPDTLDQGLVQNGIAIQTMTIKNIGVNLLSWTMTILPPAPWFSLQHDFGNSGPGDSILVDATFNAAGLAEGVYQTTIQFDSNDPVAPQVIMPVTLTIAPGPDIAVAPSLLEFPLTFVGSSSMLLFTVTNNGGVNLDVTSITSNNPVFAATPTTFSVAGGANTNVSVTFTPTTGLPEVGLLTILSNDIDGDTAYVSLTGIGPAAPVIDAAPDTLRATVAVDGSAQKVLNIVNVGAGTLEYELLHVADNGGASAPPATPREPQPDLPASLTTAGGRPKRDVPQPEAAAPTITTVADNFEDNDFNGWTVVASNFSVTATTAARNTSFSLNESNATAGPFNGVTRGLGATQIHYVSFWVRSSNTGQNDAYFVLTDGSGNEAIWFFATQNGTLYCNADTGGDSSHPYTADVWYHIEFTNLDYVTKTFDYVVNGATIAAAVSFRNINLVNEMSNLDLWSFSAGAESWWDEIVLLSDLPPTWLSGSPLSGSAGAGLFDQVTVSFDATGLAVGVHEGTIPIENNAINGLHEVHVELTVALPTGIRPGAPSQFALGQNKPNPFNPTTTIRYAIPHSAEVRLIVYTVRGERIRTLVNRAQPAGRYEALWDGRDRRGDPVASGVYFYRLVAGEFAETRKMVLLK